MRRAFSEAHPHPSCAAGLTHCSLFHDYSTLGSSTTPSHPEINPLARRHPHRDTDRAAEGLLSIGALSAATGIPAETIRSWERRYGFPAAGRKPSGHRVYDLATVLRLRRCLLYTSPSPRDS